MGDKISVLVVDDNIEFCDLLMQYINKSENMVAVGTAKDGAEGLDMIDTLKPDVVILDMIMPNIDGIGVLEKINGMNMKFKPLFIVLSAVGQESFSRKAMDLGADYYMVKPFDIEILMNRIREIYTDKMRSLSESIGNQYNKTLLDTRFLANRIDIEFEVTNLMHEMGIPAHLSGYRYLREAVLIAIYNKKVFTSITKVLYPSIAEKFNSSPQKVERSIRNAIEAAWSNQSDGLKKIFNRKSIYYWDNKPTNSQFIAMMTEKIRAKITEGKTMK